MLAAETKPIVGAPKLPDNPLGKWHKLTAVWWADVWSSPMSAEFMRADLGALFRLAMLVDVFWKSGKLAAAAEIRLMEREFGLTPLSRRRLEWTVAQADEAAVKVERKRSSKARIVENDPREVLE